LQRKRPERLSTGTAQRGRPEGPCRDIPSRDCSERRSRGVQRDRVKVPSKGPFHRGRVVKPFGGTRGTFQRDRSKGTSREAVQRAHPERPPRRPSRETVQWNRPKRPFKETVQRGCSNGLSRGAAQRGRVERDHPQCRERPSKLTDQRNRPSKGPSIQTVQSDSPRSRTRQRHLEKGGVAANGGPF
jgi:hypothetical protein